MKKNQNKKFENWANKKLKEIQKVLLLENFNLNPIEYKNTRAYAESATHYPYKEITIYYSNLLLELWDKKDLKSIRDILTHELCHPLTDGLYAKATNRYSTQDEIGDERESLTDHIANILIRHKIIK